jgi:hypothetical protein
MKLERQDAAALTRGLSRASAVAGGESTPSHHAGTHASSPLVVPSVCLHSGCSLCRRVRLLGLLRPMC